MAKILIVDDDSDILTVASMLLKMNGFDVETIDTGAKAIEGVISTKPDIVLLDVNLAGEDGRQICKYLKNNINTQSIPVVLFSANHEIDKSYFDCGADGFIAKPFETMEFIATLKKYV